MVGRAHRCEAPLTRGAPRALQRRLGRGIGCVRAGGCPPPCRGAEELLFQLGHLARRRRRALVVVSQQVQEPVRQVAAELLVQGTPCSRALRLAVSREMTTSPSRRGPGVPRGGGSAGKLSTSVAWSFPRQVRLSRRMARSPISESDSSTSSRYRAREVALGRLRQELGVGRSLRVGDLEQHRPLDARRGLLDVHLRGFHVGQPGTERRRADAVVVAGAARPRWRR